MQRGAGRSERQSKSQGGMSKSQGGMRHRKQAGESIGMAETTGWSSALDPEFTKKGRVKKQKKSGRNQAEERTFETDVDNGAAGSELSPHRWLKVPSEPTPALGPRQLQPAGAAFNMHKLSESLFVSWEELLGQREALKRRIDTIAAVHGWQGASAQQCFLGGVEPSALLDSIQAEIVAMEPAAEALEAADVLLQLQACREQCMIVGEERDRLAEDLQQSQEESFQMRDQLAGQSMELETLREQAVAVARVKASNAGSDSAKQEDGCGEGGLAEVVALSEAGLGSSSDPLAAFKVALSRGQVVEGRRIVQTLERLKVPDESVMGPRELACWHENKKTIMNSLKTLSSQIYSATTRILYEIIQNADDCTFENDSDIAEGDRRAVRELYLECSDEALIAYHNEKGFQPKDLYAMCQVGESSKAAGSGKIGRKGIGFKSVFQICDRPVVLSPPFQFCFDTVKHEVFGYIVPSWVDIPEEHVPEKYRVHLERIFRSGAPSSTGTLLVCPMAARVRGLDLMRDLSFDGLSLAFLKNLEQISFVSSVSHGAPRQGDAGLSHAVSTASSARATQSTRRKTVYRVERIEEEVSGQQGVADGVLKGVSLVDHTLSQCTIIRGENKNETRRHYRLHSYTILKYKHPDCKAGAYKNLPTTRIELAFPVDESLKPMRSEDGELIFAYLPVTAAGFGFAINADFELVASRQDVSDSHSGNHVLLGRIPALFVHALLTDPVLGEDAFPMYLPDVEGIRKDRSGGGRKWHSLASALHRQTGAWMMIPTEDVPERVKRKHVVLRPKHLSKALVPNSLLKEVTRNFDSGEQNFAHEDAVVDMALENCIDVCPVNVVLDCIRAVLYSVNESDEGGADDVTDRESKKKQKGKKQRVKNVNVWPEDTKGDVADYARQYHTDNAQAAPVLSISENVLLDIWQYLSSECEACLKQGEAGKGTLQLIVSAVIGGIDPFRIFPVRGSPRLRLHSEHGVPLSNGLSPSLAAQSSSVLRLAERVVPRFDTDRLQGVEGIAATIHFLSIRDATEVELEQQLRNCFRFGIATTADPQLWWDSFRYAVLRGYPHGLVDFMPGSAIALPLTESRNRVVSSHDVQRLSVGLPCLLGLQRKPASGSKYLLAIPPSVSTWCARVHWELAVVQAFGVTYPKSDIERINTNVFVTDLFYAVAEARDAGRTRTIEALGELLDIYESRLGSLLPLLRSAARTSPRPEMWLLEKRAQFLPFTESCSPKFVNELLMFCSVELSDNSFHNIRDLLERSLGMLRLRLVGVGKPKGDAATAEAEHEVTYEAELAFCLEGNSAEDEYHDTDDSVEFESAVEEVEEDVVEDEDEEEDEDNDEEACDEATWDLLQRLLCFKHTFKTRHCPWLLYSVLTPALVEKKEESTLDEPHAPTLNPIASSMKSFIAFIAELEIGTIMGCSGDSDGCQLDVAADLWPLIAAAGGMWLGGNFVVLDRCVWRSGGGEMMEALTECGCLAGHVVAIESMLITCMDEAHTTHAPCLMHEAWMRRMSCLRGESRTAFLAAIGSCCSRGSSKRQGSTRVGLKFPGLPHPTDLEMMLNSTLPMLLERELVNVDSVMPERGCEHQWSHAIISCYGAVISTLANGMFPRGQRLRMPVLSTNLQICQVVVDRGLNRQLARDAAALLVLPDESNCPTATAFVLRHFAEECLHPGLVLVFAPVAEMQSVGLELPCARVQRTFKHSLRLATTDVTASVPVTPGEAAAAAAASRVEGSNDVLDKVWALISEVYERPLVSEASAGDGPASIPTGLSDADNWELLMWAAITCAKEWFLMQAMSNPQHASRYQETLQRVRRLVPFIKSGESWGFLNEQHGSTDNGVMLLRTLFGFQLWGNLHGLELLERAPAYTTDIPTRILLSCTSTSAALDNPATSGNFPENFERASLVLIWEWFLVEVAGAVPPAVLWSTVQEPIAAWTRPRIRQAEATLRAESTDELSLCLLDCVCGHTRVATLMDEMDAVDEARAAAAAREAETRRREREAAQVRQREEAEALRRQREWARQEEELWRFDERNARRSAQNTMDANARMSQPQSPPQQQRGNLPPRDDPTEPARPQQNQSSRTQEPPPLAAVAAAAPEMPQNMRDEMQEMIRAQQQQIDLMRSQMQMPRPEVQLRGLRLEGMANTFARMFGGGAAGGSDRSEPSVRRHVDGQTMRESEVKGKLARFIAGMRAYERQQAASRGEHGGDSAQQQMPPVLSEFIAWAGDLLAGEQQQGSGGGGESRSGGASRVEETARRYMTGHRSGIRAAAQEGEKEEEEELCCICLEVLCDTAVYEQLGEPLQTMCGHRFHAVCYAKTMENSQLDPWCPICRSDNFGTVRFL